VLKSAVLKGAVLSITVLMNVVPLSAAQQHLLQLPKEFSYDSGRSTDKDLRRFKSWAFRRR
jgi:hypothetical protein